MFVWLTPLCDISSASPKVYADGERLWSTLLASLGSSVCRSVCCVSGGLFFISWAPSDAVDFKVGSSLPPYAAGSASVACSGRPSLAAALLALPTKLDLPPGDAFTVEWFNFACAFRASPCDRRVRV